MYNTMKHVLCTLTLLWAALGAHPLATEAATRVTDLRVCGLRTPLGIDRTPVFSWKTESDSRGFRQKSYSVTVTDSRGTTVWQSGEKASSAQYGISYGGPALRSHSAYRWQVTLQGADGTTATAADTFEMAFTEGTPWTAHWISAPRQPNARVEASLGQHRARYIKIDMTKLGLPASTDNTGRYAQFAEVEVYGDGQQLAYTAIASSNMNYGSIWNVSYLNDGIVYDGTHLGWTTAKFTTTDKHITLVLDLGSERNVDALVLYPRQDDHANGNSALAANFPEDFTVQGSTDGNQYDTYRSYTGMRPSWADNSLNVPYLGRTFSMPGKTVSRARLYASGLGVFTMQLNGQAVTENKLEPGESEYEKTVLYSTYDVTPLLRQGANTLLAQVTGGIYNVRKLNDRFSKGEINNNGTEALIAELHIDYSDGSHDTLCTDTTWRCAPSATLGCNWWGGEDYDARLHADSLNKAGLDLSGWARVNTVTPLFASSQASGFGQLRSRMYEPLRVVEAWKAVKVNTTHSGGYTLRVVDFGRNFAGQYRFRLKGKAGQTITLREGESLNADGSVFMENYYTGPADTYDTYTFRGDADGEEWGPQLMYHGFRYLQIIGLDEEPSPEAFTALRIRCNMDSTGSVAGSDSLINGIHTICRDAIASQLYNTITDCPHREKLGWLDVPNEMFNSLAYNFDMQQLMHKVTMDCFDAQLSDGHVPSTVPHYMSVYDNDPNWGGSAILVPYRCWKTYGDTTLMQTYYQPMKRLMNYYTGQTTNGIMNNISVLSDWGQESAGVNPMVSTEFTITTTYYYMLRAMAEMAGAMGHRADSVTFSTQADATRTAFNRRWLKDGSYGNGQQAELAMPLYYGLVPEEQRSRVAAALAKRVEADGYTIKTGEIGLKPLLMSLADNGYNDVVFAMSQQTTCPSYGYWVKQGYTTTPEYWNVGAFSQNHCMMDHIEEWLYSELGGIHNMGTAFDTLLLKPYIPSALTHFRATARSPYGDIVSQWRRTTDGYAYEFCVPANSTATIVVPVPTGQRLTEDGHEVEAGKNGVKSVSYGDSTATLRVGSGHYLLTTGKATPTAIARTTVTQSAKTCTYSLAGTPIGAHAQGVCISGGKKYIARQ